MNDKKCEIFKIVLLYTIVSASILFSISLVRFVTVIVTYEIEHDPKHLCAVNLYRKHLHPSHQQSLEGSVRKQNCCELDIFVSLREEMLHVTNGLYIDCTH